MAAFFPVFVLFLAVVGGLFFSAGMGLRTSMKSHEGKLNSRQVSQVRSILVAWRFSISQEQESTVFRTLYSYLAQVRSAILTAGGIGLLVASLLLSGLALVIFGTLLVKDPSQIQPLVLPIVDVAMVLGIVGGLLFALHQIKRQASLGVRFGDLSQRQSADYRSPFVHLLALPTFSLVTLSTIQLQSFVGMTVPSLQAQDTVLFVPSWTLWIIPTLMLIIVVLTEVLITRIARFPRFLVTLMPESARRYDDMLRALFAGQLLFIEFLAISCLTWAQCGLINLNLAVLHNTQPEALSALLVLSYLSAMLLFFVASLVLFRHGRLGGRISRQIRRAQLEATS